MYTIKNHAITLHADTYGACFVIETESDTFKSNNTFICRYIDKNGIEHSLTNEPQPIVQIAQGVSPAISYTFSQFTLRIFLPDHTDTVHFSLTPHENENISEFYWPAPIQQTFSHNGYAVLPVMQGLLIKDTECDAHNVFEASYAGRDFTMPWWGQVSESGSYMALVNTPYDACLYYDHKQNQSTRVNVAWRTSLGKIGYARELALRFFDSTVNYVDFCRIYREELINAGKFNTLEEKAAANPQLLKMPGRPVLTPPMIYYQVEPESTFYKHENPERNCGVTPFSTVASLLRESKESGIENAYVHIDGWSLGGYDNLFPRVLPINQQAGGAQGLLEVQKTCRELDYLLVYHDQYRDFYLKSPDYDENLAVRHEDGSTSTMEEIVWYGGYETQLCATQALSFVKRNYQEMFSLGLKPDGAYLDVFSACILDECFHPAHQMTREDCVKLRKACLGYIRNNDMIISSEELVGEFADALDVVHHAPYATAFMKDKHIQVFGTCAPLMNLVFHDSVITPWGLGNDVWGLPQGESGLLHCLLNGGTPYIDTKADANTVADCKVAQKLHRSVAFSQMLCHQFIDGTHKQKSCFSNGVEVTVDFSEGSYYIVWEDKTQTVGKTHIA